MYPSWNFPLSPFFHSNKGLVLAAGTSAGSLLNFVGTTGASGLPIGQFEQVGTENLGSTSENRALQRPDHTDFGPRLGIAWRPLGNEKTVIRTGGGVASDHRTHGTGGQWEFATRDRRPQNRGLRQPRIIFQIV